MQGAATITFGDMRDPGTTILNGPTSLSSSGFWLDSGRTLQNNATFTWTGGNLDLNINIDGVSLPGTGSITNAASGLFLVQGDLRYQSSSPATTATPTPAPPPPSPTPAPSESRQQRRQPDLRLHPLQQHRHRRRPDRHARVYTRRSGQWHAARSLRRAISSSTAASTTGNLVHNGLAATSLELGANNITVNTDYNNASFGTGNSFNRRANVRRHGADPRRG